MGVVVRGTSALVRSDVYDAHEVIAPPSHIAWHGWIYSHSRPA
jgi:hypothetical protein